MSPSEMLLLVIALVLVTSGASQRIGNNVQYRPNMCLPGDKHVELPRPRPENSSYKACHQWKNGSCCTPEFTVQLANSNVTNIDGFHWNRCGDISQQCRRFFIEIECFYRCSPNIAHFANLVYPSALANLPICGDYCNRWYDACKNDMTCAANWITDWVYLNGSNFCAIDATCKSFSEVYRNGRGICNTLWGGSFFYSNYTSNDTDGVRQCLVPYFGINETNPNSVVIEKFFANGGHTLNVGSALLLAAALIVVMTLLM